MPTNQISQFLTSRTGLLTGFIIAIALLIFVMVDAYTRYQAVTRMQAKITAAEQVEPVKKTSARPAGDMHQLASLQLFGKTAIVHTAPKPEAAPATRLKLTLLGIAAAHDGSLSRAIIQIDNKQTAIYEVGDSLPTGNAEVHEILPDKVLLMRNGKLESLAIDRPTLMKPGRKQVNADNASNSTKIEDKILMLPDDAEPASTSPDVPPADR